MCGIVGFIGDPDPIVLERMAASLQHRGPDDGGFCCEGPVSLVHRRLAIVDLAGGHQPMVSGDGQLVLVFNGEIYNHPQLKRQFEARGHRYRTRSDTETILHAYIEHGPGCVDHLDGMFAFVLYDRQRQLLFGARDRMGKKPLYFTGRQFGSIEFAFASELRRCGPTRKLLRADRCRTARWFRICSTTMFRGHAALMPGFSAWNRVAPSRTGCRTKRAQHFGNGGTGDCRLKSSQAQLKHYRRTSPARSYWTCSPQRSKNG